MIANDFIAIAHRGAMAYAPENTRAAFELALHMGAKHIELDVHATADGQAAVIHDKTLDRTTNGTGLVADRSMAELKTLDAGSWFDPRFAHERIPEFSETLERYAQRAHLHTEIKSAKAGFTEHIADLIRAHGAERNTTIMAFEIARLEEMRRYAPELGVGWLVYKATDTVIATAQSAGIDLLCPKANYTTSAQVQRLHREGFMVRIWGVQSEAKMRKTVKSGADGMTIDFPDKLLRYLRECRE